MLDDSRDIGETSDLYRMHLTTACSWRHFAHQLIPGPLRHLFFPVIAAQTSLHEPAGGLSLRGEQHGGAEPRTMESRVPRTRLGYTRG